MAFVCICHPLRVFFGGIPPVILSGSADLFLGKHLGSINGFLMIAYGLGGGLAEKGQNVIR